MREYMLVKYFIQRQELQRRRELGRTDARALRWNRRQISERPGDSQSDSQAGSQSESELCSLGREAETIYEYGEHFLRGQEGGVTMRRRRQRGAVSKRPNDDISEKRNRNQRNDRSSSKERERDADADDAVDASLGIDDQARGLYLHIIHCILFYILQSAYSLYTMHITHHQLT